ncbi:MAG: M48 family metalloprotease [Bacteroidetes bacterium]|nr:M48 family metalloprotease [Bacteroidota bacterium]
MKLFLLVLLFFISKNEFSQSFGSHPIALTPEKKENFYFNDSLYKAALYERYKSHFKNKDRLDEFIEINAESAKDILSTNEIYTNLISETAYINSIFKKTIPSEYLSDNLKIYIIRDASVNAYCREDGSIFVNIGLLSILDNEAELAAVLSHEFGHYYSNHSVKGYKKAKNATILAEGFFFLGPYGFIPSVITVGKYYGDLRSQEKESDMFSVKFFGKNNYSPDAILSIQNKFLQYSNNSKNRKGYQKHYALFNTHPPSQKRLAYLKDSILANKLSGKNNYLVDSVMFKTIKQRAIDEVIYLNFFQANLNDCIEKSYLQHLYSPKDEFYIYFITECLRRKIALFPKSGNEYFITSVFKRSGINSNPIKKPVVSSIKFPETEKSIHLNLKNVYEFEFKENTNSQIAYNELLDTSNIEFVTNTDALKYFTAVAEKTNYKAYPIFKNQTTTQMPEQYKTTELEKVFYEQTFLASKNPNTGYKKISYPFFFNNYYTGTRGKKSFSKKQITNLTSVYKDFHQKNPISLQDTSFNTDVFIFPELDFRDSYQNTTWLDLLSMKVVADSWQQETAIKKKYIFSDVKKVLKITVNLESDFPELYAISKKYGYKKLYFADLLDNEGDSQLFYKAQIGILIYCIDFSKGTVERYCFKYKPRYLNSVSNNYYNIARSLSEVVEKTK